MLYMLHTHVGLSRPFYLKKIYSFIHIKGTCSDNYKSIPYRTEVMTEMCYRCLIRAIDEVHGRRPKPN